MSDVDVFDLDEDFDELTDESRAELLGELSSLIEELGEAQEAVAEREEELKNAQRRVRELEEQAIPELMEELHVASIQTTSGLKAQIEKKIRVGRVKSPEALAWAEENGYSGVIKTAVSVSFPVDRRAEAKLLHEELQARGVDTKAESFIEWGTAAALLKERRKNGEEAPLEIFKASDFTRAKVTRAK